MTIRREIRWRCTLLLRRLRRCLGRCVGCGGRYMESNCRGSVHLCQRCWNKHCAMVAPNPRCRCILIPVTKPETGGVTTGRHYHKTIIDELVDPKDTVSDSVKEAADKWDKVRIGNQKRLRDMGQFNRDVKKIWQRVKETERACDVVCRALCFATKKAAEFKEVIKQSKARRERIKRMVDNAKINTRGYRGKSKPVG